ncbi:hypothetical protein PAXINDRAFT_79935, partial [Paxillus involutus ATCC 200175]
SPFHFNRKEVKEAIHAPVDTEWAEWADVNVFPDGDSNFSSCVHGLPNVVEKSVRSVIVHGITDSNLIAAG